MEFKILKSTKFVGALGLALGLGFLSNAKSADTDTRKLKEYTELEVSEGVTVILKKCSKVEDLEAKVEAQGIPVKDIVTKLKGENTVTISIKKGKTNPVDTSQKIKKQKATVYLTYKNINKIKIRSAASVSLDSEEKELSTKILEISADSAAKVTLNVYVDDLKITSKSGAKVKLTGKSTTANIDASAASVDVSEIELKEADVTVASAGNVNIFATKILKATVTSLGKLTLLSNPKEQKIERSLGDIKQKSEK